MKSEIAEKLAASTILLAISVFTITPHISRSVPVMTFEEIIHKKALMNLTNNVEFRLVTNLLPSIIFYPLSLRKGTAELLASTKSNNNFNYSELQNMPKDEIMSNTFVNASKHRVFRLIPAVFAIFVPPMLFWFLRNEGISIMTAFTAAILLPLDSLFVNRCRLFVPDALTYFFSLLGLALFSTSVKLFANNDKKPKKPVETTENKQSELQTQESNNLKKVENTRYGKNQKNHRNSRNQNSSKKQQPQTPKPTTQNNQNEEKIEESSFLRSNVILDDNENSFAYFASAVLVLSLSFWIDYQCIFVILLVVSKLSDLYFEKVINIKQLLSSVGIIFGCIIFIGYFLAVIHIGLQNGPSCILPFRSRLLMEFIDFISYRSNPNISFSSMLSWPKISNNVVLIPNLCLILAILYGFISSFSNKNFKLFSILTLALASSLLYNDFIMNHLQICILLGLISFAIFLNKAQFDKSNIFFYIIIGFDVLWYTISFPFTYGGKINFHF